MTREEIVKELLFLARNSEDAAVANDAGVAAHQTEWERLCTDISVNHERLSEIRHYVIEWKDQAKRLRKEARVFRQAAALLDAECPR